MLWPGSPFAEDMIWEASCAHISKSVSPRCTLSLSISLSGSVSFSAFIAINPDTHLYGDGS